MGVEILVEGLLEATTTYLTVLVLHGVGMGDVGIAALAPLVSEGRMRQLTHLNLSENGDVTNEGIIPLQRRLARMGCLD